MTPLDAQARLIDYAVSKGVTLTKTSAEIGIRTMVDFYVDDRLEGYCSGDDDVLLYECGTLPEWEPPGFCVSIMRQFTVVDADKNVPFVQLHIAFVFDRLPGDPAILPDGNRWCRSVGDAEVFLAFIRAGDAHRLLCDRRPRKVGLGVEEC